MKEYNELTEKQRKELEEQFLHDPDFFYKKASLMKMGNMLSKARITKQGYIPNTKD